MLISFRLSQVHFWKVLHWLWQYLAHPNTDNNKHLTKLITRRELISSSKLLQNESTVKFKIVQWFHNCVKCIYIRNRWICRWNNIFQTIYFAMRRDEWWLAVESRTHVSSHWGLIGWTNLHPELIFTPRLEPSTFRFKHHRVNHFLTSLLYRPLEKIHYNLSKLWVSSDFYCLYWLLPNSIIQSLFNILMDSLSSLRARTLTN